MGNKDVLCRQELAGTKKIKVIPELKFLDQPVAMRSAVCGLKASCCDIASANYVAGWFENFDLQYDGMINAALRFQGHRMDLIKMLLKGWSKFVFAYKGDLQNLYQRISSQLDTLGTISNENVFVRGANLYNLILGYYTGLLCSICDPYQRLYLSRTFSAAPKLQHPPSFSLVLRDSLCIDIGSSFAGLSTMITTFIHDSSNANAVKSIIDGLCEASAERYNPSSRFPIPVQDCQRMKEDYDSLRNMVLHLDGPFSLLFGCDSASSCASFICEEVLQGLAFTLEPIRTNFKNTLAEYCRPEIGCNPSRLELYVDFAFPSDAVLTAEGWFSDGEAPTVQNQLTSFANATAFDVERFGCGQYLSRYSCQSFPDITFTSAHFQGIIIASSIVGVLMMFGIYMLYRKFVLTCTKRSDIAKTTSTQTPLLPARQS